jgi:hypothetical protein
MLKNLMYPKVWWMILHALAVTITFLIGYSMKFGYG